MRGCRTIRLALAGACLAESLAGQAPRVTVRAATASLTVDAGTAVTAVFRISNATGDSVRVTPALALPAGWVAVAGAAAFVISPRSTDTWLSSIGIPRSAAAGRYVLRGGLSQGQAGQSDSVVVIVSARRALEAVAVETPGWVLSGGSYQARFLVLNRGNVPAAVALAGSTSRGTKTVTDPSTLQLAPGSSAQVTVRVAAALNTVRTADDVIQLTATDQADAASRAFASARTTIVPRNTAVAEYSTMPAMLAVRSVGGASGVSPLVLAGSGRLADERTQVDFLLQAPTDQRSPWGFGERDEYRLNVVGTGYRVRLGDNSYGRSALTSSGLMGTGAEAAIQRGALEFGAYAQRLRWTPGNPSEQGAFATLSSDSSLRATAGVLARESGGASVHVADVGGTAAFRGFGKLELDAAASDSAHTGGGAGRARFSGATDGVQYDLRMMRGSDGFAGPVRSTSAEDGMVSAQLSKDLVITASGGSHSWAGGGTPASRIEQRFSTATLAASWKGATVEYGWLARRISGAVQPMDGAQQGLRFTDVVRMGRFAVSGSVEHGLVHDHLSGDARDYTLLSLDVRTGLGDLGSVSLSGTRSLGSTLTGANNDVLGAAASAQLRLPHGFELGVSTSAQRATFGVLDSSGAWFSVSDARLDRRFANGSSIGLHARMLQTPRAMGSPNSSAVYLEYRAPLRLPTGPSHERGRATGIVRDAERGQAVSGVLVRLGDQAAVSDRQGRVTFSGLEARMLRVSVEPVGAAAGALLVGDVNVDMRHPSDTPRQFEVAVTRGGRVTAFVRRHEAGPTLGSAAGTSMDEASPLAGVLVGLQGVRDTIYLTTSPDGRVDFGEVPPGEWMLAVQPAVAPPNTVFERSSIEVTVRAGERREVEFRLVEARRAVQMIGPGTTLRAKGSRD